jgi:hypothetical protein
MKKLFTFVASWLILQGCTSFDEALDRSASAGDFNPLTLSTVNVEKYKEDKQFCFKQVQSQTNGSMNQNYSIIKFRECLIQKGYVLLS